MLRIVQQFILTTLIVVFASQASALFIQPDWFDPTEPGVGTNRYSYSFNDPVNSSDPGGNACGGACSEEDQARIDATEPIPMFDETAASIDNEIARLQDEISQLPTDQAPTTGCNSPRECGTAAGLSSITRGDLLMLQMNGLVGLRSVVPADTTEAGLAGVGTMVGGGLLLKGVPNPANLGRMTTESAVATQAVISDMRALRSLHSRIQEHVDKINQLRANPTAPPGMERAMRDGTRQFSDREIRSAVDRRILHFQREIRAFQSEFDRIRGKY